MGSPRTSAMRKGATRKGAKRRNARRTDQATRIRACAIGAAAGDTVPSDGRNAVDPNGRTRTHAGGNAQIVPERDALPPDRLEEEDLIVDITLGIEVREARAPHLRIRARKR